MRLIKLPGYENDTSGHMQWVAADAIAVVSAVKNAEGWWTVYGKSTTGDHFMIPDPHGSERLRAAQILPSRAGRVRRVARLRAGAGKATG